MEGIEASEARGRLVVMLEGGALSGQLAGELNESGFARRGVKLKGEFAAWVRTVPDDDPDLLALARYSDPDSAWVGGTDTQSHIARLGNSTGKYTLPMPDDHTETFRMWLTGIANLARQDAEFDG